MDFLLALILTLSAALYPGHPTPVPADVTAPGQQCTGIHCEGPTTGNVAVYFPDQSKK